MTTAVVDEVYGVVANANFCHLDGPLNVGLFQLHVEKELVRLRPPFRHFGCLDFRVQPSQMSVSRKTNVRRINLDGIILVLQVNVRMFHIQLACAYFHDNPKGRTNISPKFHGTKDFAPLRSNRKWTACSQSPK